MQRRSPARVFSLHKIWCKVHHSKHNVERWMKAAEAMQCRSAPRLAAPRPALPAKRFPAVPVEAQPSLPSVA